MSLRKPGLAYPITGAIGTSNYPALMINDTSFVRNPNYYQATDKMDTLDFEKMSEVVNSLYMMLKAF